MSQSLAYEVMCFSELVRLDLLGCSSVWGWSVQTRQGRLRDEADEDADAFLSKHDRLWVVVRRCCSSLVY